MSSFDGTLHQVTITNSMTSVTNWTLFYYHHGSSDITSRSHDADSMGDILTGLDKGTSYVVSVAASNTAGMGPFGDNTATTLIDGEWCSYVNSRVLTYISTCEWLNCVRYTI